MSTSTPSSPLPPTHNELGSSSSQTNREAKRRSIIPLSIRPSSFRLSSSSSKRLSSRTLSLFPLSKYKKIVRSLEEDFSLENLERNLLENDVSLEALVKHISKDKSLKLFSMILEGSLDKRREYSSFLFSSFDRDNLTHFFNQYGDISFHLPGGNSVKLHKNLLVLLIPKHALLFTDESSNVSLENGTPEVLLSLVYALVKKSPLNLHQENCLTYLALCSELSLKEKVRECERWLFKWITSQQDSRHTLRKVQWFFDLPIQPYYERIKNQLITFICLQHLMKTKKLKKWVASLSFLSIHPHIPTEDQKSLLRFAKKAKKINLDIFDLQMLPFLKKQLSKRELFKINIRFSGTTPFKLRDRQFEALEKLPINSLDLSNCTRLSSKCLTYFANSRMTRLQVNSLELDHAFFEILQSMPELIELSLNNCTFKEEDFFCMLPNTIKKLSLVACDKENELLLNDLDVMDLPFGLESLNLSKNAITGTCFDYLKLMSLKELSLQDCPIQSDRLELLGAHTSLEKFNLQGCKITKGSLKNLPLTLTALNLSHTDIDTDEMTFLNRLVKLTHLDLSFTPINNEHLRTITQLPLEVLRLNGCEEISEVGLKTLPTTLKILFLKERKREIDFERVGLRIVHDYLPLQTPENHLGTYF
ncbi:hypothetical protein PHSC3_000619 [Chlamydiales bacterium STE3]|nr:hypothetical protein PHSC3_000619 [Chlamydiales bacterium STE3]